MADSAADRQPAEATTRLAELARRATHWPAVILDDDPTGTQTVRDLPVLTEWDAGRIARHLAAGEPAVFLSTNARACRPGSGREGSSRSAR